MTDDEMWVRWLIETDDIERFYHSRKWKRVRDEVSRMDHCECQRCKDRGVLTFSRTVHHVNELKLRPDLALSIYYMDGDGERQRNLLTLCRECHNEVHERFNHRKRREPLTSERW